MQISGTQRYIYKLHSDDLSADLCLSFLRITRIIALYSIFPLLANMVAVTGIVKFPCYESKAIYASYTGPFLTVRFKYLLV